MDPQQHATQRTKHWRRRAVPAPFLAAVLGLAVLAAGAAGVLWSWQAAARRAARQYDFAAAERSLERCLRVRPRNVPLILEAARVARLRGDLVRAEAHVARAERLAPQSPDVVLERRLLRAVRGELLDVGPVLAALVEPGRRADIPSLEALAAGLLATGRLSEAQARLESILEMDPDRAPAILWRAQVFQALRWDDRALTDLRHAVECAPAWDAAHLALAEALLGAGFEREAAGHFELVRRQEPGGAEALLGLAACRFDAGEMDEAARLLDALLVHHPDHPSGLTERGRLALRAGEPARAEELCRKALAADPLHATAWRVLSLALQAGGHSQDAARALDESCRIEGARTRLWHLLTELQDKPNDPDILTQYGAASLALNQPAEAERVLRLALAADPQYEPARELLRQMRQRSRRAPTQP